MLSCFKETQPSGEVNKKTNQTAKLLPCPSLTFRLLRAGISVTLAGFACALHNEQHRNPARCMLTGCKNNYNYQEGGTIED
jgi:hypothetical protein